ncbi:MAG: carboxypeptidase regulatory-like domain-containing protein [Gemmatimonadetes bacterium]|nr:carboxypeptidase regulatory-like domain-containing protein [Gemmatimonadota bacterium]
MFKRLKFLTLGLALVLPLAACDDDEAPPPPTQPEDQIGNISGAALIEGAALPGATIAIAGPQASTAVTDAAGAYSFTGVPVGAYTVTISGHPSDITFATVTFSVTVASGGTATADFAGTYIRTAAIAVLVTVDTGEGAEGAPDVPITVTGTEEFANQTGADGSFTFTGIRKGNYTIVIDVSGLSEKVVISTSQTTAVDVGQTIALVFAGAIAQEPTVSISNMVVVGTGGIVNPAAVVGTIAVTVNHDAGDEQATRLALLLNDVEVDFQTFSTTGVAAGLEGPARTPGDPVTFAVFTAAFDPATFLVTYPNGLYTVSVQLTTSSGKVATATLGTPLTFANLDVLTVRHLSGGKGVVAKGVRWWGAEDIIFEAIAIIYSQAVTIADIAVTAKGIAGSANATSVDLDLGSGHGAQKRDTSAPFQYTASLAKNGTVAGTHTSVVEDVFVGLTVPQGQTLTITSVRDAAGVDILPDFAPGTNTALKGFMVDFVPPKTNDGGTTLIGVDGVDIPVTNTATTGVANWYGNDEDYELTPSATVTELGVGGKNTVFDIDDQGTTTTDPDFTGIGGPGDLPENDNDGGKGFVAELVSLMDNLGNATDLKANPVDAAGPFGDNRSDEHGTDFGAPVTSKIFPDPAVTLVLNPDDEDANGDNDINWDTDDNKLADGSAGSGMHSRITTDLEITDPSGKKADVTCHILTATSGGAAAVGTGSAAIDYSVNLTTGCFEASGGVGPLDGLWEFDIDIPDLAIEKVNKTPIAWTIIIDATDPTTQMNEPPSGFYNSTTSQLSIPVKGQAIDANGLSEVLVTIRDASTSGSATACELTDTLWPEGGAAGEVDENTFDVTASAAAPGFSVNVIFHNPNNSQTDFVCFFIESADNASDNTGDLEPNLSDESVLSQITWN